MDKKNLICYFKKGEVAGSLLLSTVNAETKSYIGKYCYKIAPENVLHYIKKPPKFITKNVKVVIFNQVEAFKNRSFSDTSEFIRFIFSEFKKLNIPLRLISNGNFNLTSLLIAVKANPKIDKNFLFILISSDAIFVEEVYRIKEGYMCSPIKQIQAILCPDEYDPMQIKDEILAEHPNPANKIYIVGDTICSSKILSDMLQVFGYDKVLNMDDNNENETIIEIVKHLLNKSCNQYYVIPRFIFVVKNTQDQYTHYLPCNLTEGLPFKDSYLAERKRGQYYKQQDEHFVTHCTLKPAFKIQRYYKDQKEAEIIQMYPFLEGQYHRVNLTFEVDSNMIPKLTQQPYIDPKIEQLPKFLMNKIDSKSKRIPVIGFFNNSSVICLWNKKEKCYEFSKNWNGLYGEDLYIAFDEEKPKYRNHALQTLQDKPSFVVYDILDIVAAQPNNLWISPEWKFIVTKDDENPIWLKFDNFDGTQKLATPEFLMALLIKDHVKAIKEEMGGKKPTKIGVVFFDEYENTEVEDGSLLAEKIKTSCSLLKLGCKVISIDNKR